MSFTRLFFFPLKNFISNAKENLCFPYLWFLSLRIGLNISSYTENKCVGKVNVLESWSWQLKAVYLSLAAVYSCRAPGSHTAKRIATNFSARAGRQEVGKDTLLLLLLYKWIYREAGLTQKEEERPFKHRGPKLLRKGWH